MTSLSDPSPAKDLIFVIGLNKCGTTSLHHLFSKSGVKSVHWRTPKGVNVALRMLSNLAQGRRPFEEFEGTYKAFSDVSYIDDKVYIEGCRMFREMREAYPKAYFILNTRDRENWISSRIAHHRGGDGPSIISRVKAATGRSEAEIVEGWRHLFEVHHDEVRKYFKRRAKFLEFNIESDDPADLASFLAKDHTIDPSLWGKQNATRTAAPETA